MLKEDQVRRFRNLVPDVKNQVPIMKALWQFSMFTFVLFLLHIKGRRLRNN